MDETMLFDIWTWTWSFTYIFDFQRRNEMGFSEIRSHVLRRYQFGMRS